MTRGATPINERRSTNNDQQTSRPLLPARPPARCALVLTAVEGGGRVVVRRAGGEEGFHEAGGFAGDVGEGRQRRRRGGAETVAMGAEAFGPSGGFVETLPEGSVLFHAGGEKTLQVGDT